MLAKRHAALGFIFVTVLLDMLAFGVVAPVMPKLISDFLGGNTARASEYLGLFITTWALMQFFFAPVLGLLSDRFGRRPVILISNFGLSLDYLIMALAPSIRWLFLGRVLAGITSASIPTATAYISDVTPAEKRSKAFGLLGAAFGVGFLRAAIAFTPGCGVIARRSVVRFAFEDRDECARRSASRPAQGRSPRLVLIRASRTSV